MRLIILALLPLLALSLAGGFAKKTASKAPKYDGKKSMMKHMRAFNKLQARDFSNVCDVYVRSPTSDKLPVGWQLTSW